MRDKIINELNLVIKEMHDVFGNERIEILMDFLINVQKIVIDDFNKDENNHDLKTN